MLKSFIKGENELLKTKRNMTGFYNYSYRRFNTSFEYFFVADSILIDSLD